MTFATKAAILSALAALVGGAAWIMITRGPAILLDLAGAITACF
jgi:hypothetical protein